MLNNKVGHRSKIGGPRNQLIGKLESEQLKTSGIVRSQVVEKERNQENRITRVRTHEGCKSLENGCKELAPRKTCMTEVVTCCGSAESLCNYWGRLRSWSQEADWSGPWKVWRKDGLEVFQIYPLVEIFLLLISKLSTILSMVLKNIILKNKKGVLPKL